MSVDLLLYCKKIPKRSAVRRVLHRLGFKYHHSIKGSPYYFWFEEKNLASMRGCWLNWSKPEAGDEFPRGTKLIFSSATYAGRSNEDLDMQNKVISELKKVIGGSVYDPQEGRYRYIVNDIPKLTYAEKSCGLVYNNALMLLQTLRDLPEEVPSLELERTLFLDEWGIPWYSPQIVRNNVALPFFVAIFEDFLKRFFIAYLEGHLNLLEKVYERPSKIDYTTLRGLLEGKTRLAEHEANQHSFQNLESANAAYERFLEINLFRVWRKRRKFSGKFYLIEEVLRNLINLRHQIIHKARLESKLNKNETLKYLWFVRLAFVELASYLEKERKFKIDLERYL